VKIINNNGQYRVTIPKDLVEDKGWNKEDVELRFIEDLQGNVFLKVIQKNQKKKIISKTTISKTIISKKTNKVNKKRGDRR